MKKIKNMFDEAYEFVYFAGEVVLMVILLLISPLWIIPYAIIKRFKK